MGSNPFLGIIYHWIGGFASATNFIPFRGIKRWSWEILWIVQGFAAWIVAPALLAWIFIPNLPAVLHAAPREAMIFAVLWGAMWGVGGLTFGLSIRYLGIALGYAISLGLCTAFGTLIPPIYTGAMHTIIQDHSGRVVLLGVAICLVAVGVNGVAGARKEREVPAEQKVEEGEADFSFAKGLAVAVFAGIMSAFFAFGLDAGKPIAAIARTQLLAHHRLDLWQNLPVLVVVLWGGFATNLLWSVVLIVRNRSVAQFIGAPGVNPMRAAPLSGDTIEDFSMSDLSTAARIAPRVLAANYSFAVLAGVVWYFQFFFYSLGQVKMGKYDFSSWTLHMASIIIFATLWGMVLREWRGTSLKTRLYVTLGLALLVGSTLVVGYGNYLKVHETAVVAVHGMQK